MEEGAGCETVTRQVKYVRTSTVKVDWAREAERLRRESPRVAKQMLKEADQIDEMLNRFNCPRCTVRIDVPNGNKYGKATPTHEITCPYA